jgi:hypothetical protein
VVVVVFVILVVIVVVVDDGCGSLCFTNFDISLTLNGRIE